MKIIVPYKKSSESAKLLKEGTGLKFLKKNSFNKSNNNTLINWGGSLKNFPNYRVGYGCKVVNNPEAVFKASNKLYTLMFLNGKVNIPPWTTNVSEALKWFPDAIVCRTNLTGHSGDGIVIADSEEEVVDAPLYTKYIKKTREVRVHVMGGQIKLVQEKKRNRDIEDVNWRVRNNHTGFIYTKNVKPVSSEGLRDAIIAVRELGLDFGAVDMIYNKAEDKWYILEVNTAPGLTESTAYYYINYINNI